MSASEPVWKRICAAAERLEGVARRTPVCTSRLLDARVGSEVFLKCENRQNVGAFKFRGAFNALSVLSDDERARGVLTYSSGNHAQAMARAGQLLGVEVVVVMPDNAPRCKTEATEAYGARVIRFDPDETKREALAATLPEAKTHVLVPPYDHDEVIAGQGTAAKELLEDTPALDYLLVPTGGGGLLAGSAVSAKHLQPGCKVIGVEPELADDAARSFHSGTLQSVQNPQTIADGTRTPSLGQRNFALIQAHVHDIVTVSEQAIAEAVLFLHSRCKEVVEPSGALGVAALLSGKIPTPARTGVILSGGNLDPETYAKLQKLVV